MSARTARALTVEGTVGPLDGRYGPWNVTDAVFLPERGSTGGLDLQNGFILHSTPWGDRQLGFVSWDPTKQMDRAVGGEVSVGPVPTGPFPDRLVMLLKGAAHAIGTFAFLPDSPSYNQLIVGQADPTANQFPVGTPTPQSLSGAATASLGLSGDIIAVGRYAANEPSAETTYWLFRTPSGSSFLEASSAVSTANAVSAPTLTALASRAGTPYALGSGIPVSSLTRALYYYDPEPTRAPQRSYLSWYDPAQGRWRCWAWWAVGASPSAWQGTELAGVDHRIDALLTTGELFSTEDDTGRVYGADGTLRTSFPLTGLSFIEEAWLNGTPRVLFSQYLYAGKSPWFVIYSIATSDIGALSAW